MPNSSDHRMQDLRARDNQLYLQTNKLEGMSMQLDIIFSGILRNTADRIRRFTNSSSSERTAELASNIKRELYGLNMREQLAAKHLLSRAGQTVVLRESTIAFGKDGFFRFLGKGSQTKLSNSPLRLDETGNVQVVLHDHGNKHLFLNLSDYLTAIDASE
jgi:hypothetical protein